MKAPAARYQQALNFSAHVAGKKTAWMGAAATGRLFVLSTKPVHEQPTKKHMQERAELKLEVEELEQRIAPSSANFAPGQFPSGNPAHAPGDSNPNEVPSNNPGHD
jgi:hypothetical protein